MASNENQNMRILKYCKEKVSILPYFNFAVIIRLTEIYFCSYYPAIFALIIFALVALLIYFV
jgi:hypothetical protein